MSTLAGIGILLIGIAFIIGAVFIALALNNFAGVLRGVEKTVEHLPEQLDDIFKETGNLIETGNDTLADVNEKLNQLSPLFYIVGDVGNATRKVTSSLVDVTESMKQKTEDSKELTEKNNLGGIYGAFALGYYWLKKRKELSRVKAEGTTSNGKAE